MWGIDRTIFVSALGCYTNIIFWVHITIIRKNKIMLTIQARRSFRALKGLVRLQGVVRGQNVKRQTVNAMKYMQLLVRVQSQIQTRRIQMLENQARRQAQYKNDKDTESNFGKWNLSQTVSFLFPVCNSQALQNVQLMWH